MVAHLHSVIYNHITLKAPRNSLFTSHCITRHKINAGDFRKAVETINQNVRCETEHVMKNHNNTWQQNLAPRKMGL